MDFINGPAIEAKSGRANWERMRRSVSERFRKMLGPGDVLIRSRENEFLMLFSKMDVKDIRSISRRMRAAVEAENSSAEADWRIEVVIDTILAPADSTSALDLLSGERSNSTPVGVAIQSSQVH